MNRRGFNASYRTLDSSCGGIFTAVSGHLHSPQYPKNYPPNETCEWKISVDISHKVEFNLLDFDIENSEDCSKDVLYIFDGLVEDPDKQLLKLCGNNMPNQTKYYSTRNEMLIVFKTDNMDEYKGFSANYSTGCGSYIVTNETGLIHMSDITRLENYNCTWTIVSDDLNKHVTLTVTHIFTVFGIQDEDNCFYYLQVSQKGT